LIRLINKQQNTEATDMQTIHICIFGMENKMRWDQIRHVHVVPMFVFPVHAISLLDNFQWEHLFWSAKHCWHTQYRLSKGM